MRAFLDSNILIDQFDAARPAHAFSTRILLSMEDGKVEPVITGLSICNMVYVLRRTGMPHEKLMRYVGVLLHHCTIASTDLVQLDAAMKGGWPDFEDAVQYHAALASGRVEAIITSDTKGFKAARIPVLTPEQFVKEHLEA